MRGWAITAFGSDLEAIDLATPQPHGTEVLLEVICCGACHTDLHLIEGHYDLGAGKKLLLKDRGVALPLIVGHEIVGRVVAAGPDAIGVAPGDVRIVYPWIGCGSCRRCIAGQDNLCLGQPRSLGVYGHGGYASHVVSPHADYLVDPGSLDPAFAATFACSGLTAYSAIRKLMPLDPDEWVVVLGAGGLGLATIAILRAMRHRRVMAVDIDPAKLDAARAAGAAATICSNGDDAAREIVAAAGGPVAAAIDLVNNASTAQIGLAILQKGGSLVQIGLFGGEVMLSLPSIPLRALTIQGSYAGTVAELRELVALAQDGGLPATPIETISLDSVNESLARLRRGEISGRLVFDVA